MKAGQTEMTKELEIGKDYYSIFGQDQSGKKQMIYNGGISWTAKDGDRTMTMDSKNKLTARSNTLIGQALIWGVFNHI
jgi:hypothetical protein